MRALGVDGCRGGWIAVALNDAGAGEMKVAAAFAQLAPYAERAMVDMPIGLPDSGRRRCDLAARERLGAARSRVFLDARRPLLQHCGDYAAANRWAKADGKGVSAQLFNILKKIDEVDKALTPALQARVLEAHPELVFQRLCGGVLPNKKTADGRARRRQRLETLGFDRLDGWLENAKRHDAAADDLYDACALAWAALHPGGTLGDGATDAHGLRMEIWY